MSTRTRFPLCSLAVVLAIAACSHDEPTTPSGVPLAAKGGPSGPPGPPSGPPAGSGMINGRKFHDFDADGTDDGGTDPGLGGWTIEVYADADKDGIRDAEELAAGPVESEVTDAAGFYEFNLKAGNYVVCEVLQPVWIQSAPANSICEPDPAAAFSGHAVKVSGGSISSGNDFGNFQPGVVSGRKFEDLDADGPTGSDPSLAGWSIAVYRDLDGNGQLDLPEFEAGRVAGVVTDLVTGYTLSLDPGTYIICEVLQPGWQQSSPSTPVCLPPPPLGIQGWAVRVKSGSTHPNHDFGNWRLGKVTGRKFHDIDGDGTDNGGADPGVGDWTINFYADVNANGMVDPDEAQSPVQVVTGANGEYSLPLNPGRYVACEELEPDWQQTAPAGNDRCLLAGPAVGPAGHKVLVQSGLAATGHDFGNFFGAAPPPPSPSSTATLTTDGACSFTSVVEWSNLDMQFVQHVLTFKGTGSLEQTLVGFTEMFLSTTTSGSSSHTFDGPFSDTGFSGLWEVRGHFGHLAPDGTLIFDGGSVTSNTVTASCVP